MGAFQSGALSRRKAIPLAPGSSLAFLGTGGFRLPPRIGNIARPKSRQDPKIHRDALNFQGGAHQ
jgi:hypothetical protein